MIIQDATEIEKITKAHSRNYLWYTPFSVVKLLDEIRGRDFPQVQSIVDVCSVDRGSLACICQYSNEANIYIHQILNHPDTPIEVFQTIHKHELLHLIIPPREIGGKQRSHPPEFWEAERDLCPERVIAWAWIWENLSDCLKRRPHLERIDVLRCWKRIWSSPRLGIEEVEGYLRKWETIKEEDGW